MVAAAAVLPTTASPTLEDLPEELLTEIARRPVVGAAAVSGGRAGEEERTGARDWGCWLWRREGANQSEKEGERLVAGTEIGVVGIWIVRGNDGEKSGSSATLGVCELVTRVLGWLVAVS